MKAKLIINEIKQNKEGSGLGSIGVGHRLMRSTYETIKANWPEILYRTVKDKVDRLSSKKQSENIKIALNYLSEILDASLDEMYWIPCDYANHSKSNKDFLNFMENEYGSNLDVKDVNIMNVKDANIMKFPKSDTYDEAHFHAHTNYKKSFGYLFYSESCGEGFDTYEQNEVNGYCIPFN